MRLVYKNRSVEISLNFEVSDGVEVNDGYFVDTGEELTEEELNEIQELRQDSLYEYCYEQNASRVFDRAKDFRKYGE